MRTSKSVDENNIRFKARHTLFVEGKDNNGIDQEILASLLQIDELGIESLGASFHVRSAAEALFKYHTEYYFLIDRDHQDIETVEKSWKNFPDSDYSNLLIWRKKEIENYFMQPEYLSKSEFFIGTTDDLKDKIICLCTERVYFDVANQVITFFRETQKRNWIKSFEKVSEINSKESALKALITNNCFSSRSKNIVEELSSKSISDKYEELFIEMTGNTIPLDFDNGKWLDRMSLKTILHQLINDNSLFRIYYKDNILSGLPKRNAVLHSLVRIEEQFLPEDFLELKKLLKIQVEKP